MAEINVRAMVDKDGVEYYPKTHILAVEGYDQDGQDESADIITSLRTQIYNLQLDVAWLQEQINAMNP